MIPSASSPSPQSLRVTGARKTKSRSGGESTFRQRDKSTPGRKDAKAPRRASKESRKTGNKKPEKSSTVKADAVSSVRRFRCPLIPAFLFSLEILFLAVSASWRLGVNLRLKRLNLSVSRL